MSKYFLYLFLSLLLYYIFTSCATVTPPSGGPKDTIAPVRINTIPADKSINYKGKVIVLEYDERIKTDKLKEQLIITPLVEDDYEFILKKNIFKISFKEPFQDSTTYTLNFRESIQDITENNPTKDNKFTFSTGSFLDSMSISGNVKKLLTYDTLENVIVGLYRAEDTVTIYNGSPYYFTQTDEKGRYLIENIKNGKYLLYAFFDDNKNLKLESNRESYGFAKDTILLNSLKTYKNIDLIKLDLSKFKLMTALPSGKYFDINFNKFITDYDIIPLDRNHDILTNLSKEGKTIRFYNNFGDIDSLQVSFSAIDSINSILTDTLFVKFKPSRRKTETFKIDITPENNAQIDTKIDVEINFSKPIISINTDSIYIQFDTTKIVEIDDSIFIWNKLKDKLSFQIAINKSLADTVLSRRIKAEQIKMDSIQQKQSEAPIKKQTNKSSKQLKPKINTGLQFYFGIGSFYSADLDTSKSIGLKYEFIEPSKNGIQNINIQTEFESFTVQLLDENFEIYKETSNQKTIRFKNLEPGRYKIRVLIDANNDGTWSIGNMLNHIEPEPVYIYPEFIVIRADWETSLNITF